MNPDCQKCGARMIGPTLVSAGGRVERLKYVCRCGYITTRPTRDANKASPGPFGYEVSP